MDAETNDAIVLADHVLHLLGELSMPVCNHGFDEFKGIPYSNDMWPVDYDGNQVPRYHRLAKAYPQLPFFNNFEVVKEIRTLENQSQLTTELTEAALDL